MDGITILNQYMTYDWPTWRYIVLIAGVAIIMLCISAVMDNCSGLWGVLALVILLGLIVLGIISPKEETGLYEYEAIIDDGVSFTDLYEQYDIVEQRGEIYILKDKEIDNNE